MDEGVECRTEISCKSKGEGALEVCKEEVGEIQDTVGGRELPLDRGQQTP